jgi:hypothetical protein
MLQGHITSHQKINMAWIGAQEQSHVNWFMTTLITKVKKSFILNNQDGQMLIKTSVCSSSR